MRQYTAYTNGDARKLLLIGCLGVRAFVYVIVSNESLNQNAFLLVASVLRLIVPLLEAGARFDSEIAQSIASTRDGV